MRFSNNAFDVRNGNKTKAYFNQKPIDPNLTWTAKELISF